MSDGFEFDSNYAEALFSVDHRVLGRRLRPFSMWHKTLLEYGGSPVLFGKIPDLAQLDYAVRVCVLRYPELPDSVPSGVFGRLWRSLCFSRFRLEKETERFCRYIDDYYTPPHILSKNGTGDTEVAPDIDDGIREVAAYRMMTCCPRSEPWDLPIGELYWMNAAMNRREGAEFRILTPQQAERLRRLKEKLDKKREEEANGNTDERDAAT